MTRACYIVAGFGFGLSVLLYVATKLRWRIAQPLWRWAPRLATLAAALLLLMFAMMATEGTSDLAGICGKGLKQVEYSLKDWFSSLSFKNGG